MPKRRNLLIAAGATLLTPETAIMADTPPPTYFVLFYQPGPKWVAEKPFNAQPGIMDHVQYMAGFFARNELVMGGPFLDNSGGIMIFDTGSIETARAIAAADPAVQAGLLTVTVKPWLAVFRRQESGKAG